MAATTSWAEAAQQDSRATAEERTMKYHFLNCNIVAVALVFAASFVMVPHVTADRKSVV